MALPVEPDGVTDAQERKIIDAAWQDVRDVAGDTARAAGSPAGPPAVPPPSGDMFPGYEVVGEIQRGGQACVYKAIQIAAKRSVAIKVLHGGPLAAARERVRFEREVQVLAQLRHPNIVAIHDSGVTAAGHLFYVMDHIEGLPLDVFFDAGQQPIRETLQLFSKICAAVNAAHLRGVIHRDLKPANIVVDAAGEPHIVDFGLAKLIAEEEGPPAVRMTMRGEFIGSPNWASPEQAQRRHDTLDIRTDVYSLGVILYQMLTGRLPYVLEGDVGDVLQVIAATPPQRPSSLRGQIDDEVETILLKCLAKEPERRYQSAGELGRDIEHYLAGDPIEAKRDSGFYVFRTLLRRHRIPVGIAAAFLIVMVGAAIWLGVLYGQAAAALARAEDESLTARQITDILEGVLAPAEIYRGKGARLTFTDVLALAEDRLKRETFKPEVEARVRRAVGTAFGILGLYDQAQPHLERALEIHRALYHGDHAEVAASLEALASLCRDQERYDEAGLLFSKALGLRRRLQGDDSLDVAVILSDLALLARLTGDKERALSLAREALAMHERLPGEQNERTVKARAPLALMLWGTDDLAAAEREYRTVIAAREALGGNHPVIANAMANLGFMLSDRGGSQQEAEKLLRDAIDMYRALGYDEHPHLAQPLTNLGIMLNDRGDYAAAIPVLRDALHANERSFGPDSRPVARIAGNLGVALTNTGDLAGADEILSRAVAIYREQPEPYEVYMAFTVTAHARVKQMQGDLDAAEQLALEALQMFRDHHPNKSATHSSLAVLARILLQKNEPARAEPLLRECLEIRRAELPPGDWLLPNTQSILGECLTALGRFEEAEQQLLEGYDGLKELGDVPAEKVRDAAARLVKLYTASGQSDKAAEYQAILDGLLAAAGK